MIRHPAFSTEPWCLRETRLHLDVLAQTESVFALSNGHIGWRANLDEGAPHGLPGTYLNGVHELRPLPYAEAGYGYPEAGQVMINVTNGKLIRLLVDDEPFDVRYGELRSHERVLDFRAGVLRRRAEWSSPAGAAIRVTSTRLVSLVQRAVAAIDYQVEAAGRPVRLVVQSELAANEPLPQASGDPRVSAVLEAPLRSQEHACDGARAQLVHRTEHSGLMVGAAMDHLVDGPASTQVLAESFADLGRVTITVSLEPGQRLHLVKFVTYGWSAVRSRHAVRDQIDAALTAARQAGWEGLAAEQRAYLDDFWNRADVEVDGDTEIQQAVPFALFHVLQAGARAEQRAIPAKGLTGPGYNGHAFWDTEIFVLPVLTYTLPAAAAHALAWRHATLPMALDRAAQLGLQGAAFPWRTITGAECSSYWPAGTAAFHVGADIADAVVRYLDATGDDAFEQKTGLELLTQTARLWRSLGCHDTQGRFRIDGVTGPDEYSAVAGNNVYTNLMAQHDLRAAAAAAYRNPGRARQLGIGKEEMTAWRDAAEAMVIPWDEALGVHPQAEGFTSHQIWDFAATTPECYPLLLHYPYFDLYRKQVVKQADLVLAMHLRGEAFTAEQKAANFAYYERLTVRDSSLSACTQAVMAAETGHLGLAHDYLAEAALMDLDDLERNTRDGLHIACLAGTWIALVAGLAGLRERDGALSFSPRLPGGNRPARVRRRLPGQPPACHGHAGEDELPADTRRPGHDIPLRPGGHRVREKARGLPDAAQPGPGTPDPAPGPAPGTRTTPPPDRPPRAGSNTMNGQHQPGHKHHPAGIHACQAWLFDLDEVLTKTAEVHAAAWKQAFDEFPDQEAARSGKTFAPSDPAGDYERYVDGEPRADGVRNFRIASRRCSTGRWPHRAGRRPGSSRSASAAACWGWGGPRRARSPPAR